MLIIIQVLSINKILRKHFNNLIIILVITNNLFFCRMAEIKTEIDGKKDKYLLYYDGESVTGKVSIIQL